MNYNEEIRVIFARLKKGMLSNQEAKYMVDTYVQQQENEIEELKARIKQLTGKQFSDRCYAAMESKNEKFTEWRESISMHMRSDNLDLVEAKLIDVINYIDNQKLRLRRADQDIKSLLEKQKELQNEIFILTHIGELDKKCPLVKLLQNKDK